MRKLVYGVGTNDAGYLVQKTINGRKISCKYYLTWQSMLRRCYSKKYQQSKKTYVGCYVCRDWLSFSSFKAWMEKQDWKGKQLDKDILSLGEKLYSPETCAFVDSMTNQFVNDSRSGSEINLTGVHWHKRDMKFVASCNNQITGKQEHLGNFDCKYEAHRAWKKRKHELSCIIAGRQSDIRVKAALELRYR